MKNNKFSSSQYKFSKHIGPMECNRLKTTKNSTLATKTGYAEVKKITKNDQQDKNAPKSETRSLDLSRVRQHFQKKSGRQTVFFSKRHLKWLFTPPSFFSTIQRHKKRDKKPLKLICDGRTDQPTDRPKSGL